eukprot:TRINITY_DN1383_c0_g1_i1.p2 TRINITY_DN1383_c0_g1~~TRINITY_DN1383_c0_g1_i1.p2  ORF type:complete len:322 (+),score=112.87 TRINITY_DN1383_c0_g1_i1:89-1054(+)
MGVIEEPVKPPQPPRRPAAGAESKLAILGRGLLGHLKVAIVNALYTLAAQPFYRAALAAWKRKGLSNRAFYVVVLLLVRSSWYWGLNSLFAWWDRTGRMQQYKLKRTDPEQPQPALMRRCLTEAAVSQFVLAPILLWRYGYQAVRHYGMPEVDTPLPGFGSLVWAHFIAHIVNDWGFYWVHRSLHASPALYRAIHKKHHEFKGTVGFAAEFAHPVEQLLANILPSVGGCIFLGRHFLVFLVWLSTRLWQTYEGHSGFYFEHALFGRLGLMHADDEAHHDFHHTVNIGNFGSCYLDRLFGTDLQWQKGGGEQGYIKPRLHRE